MGIKKTKEKIGAELIKDMELKDRINSVENLLIDTFSITNPSLRHKAELNPILSTILLDQLKVIIDIIDEDPNIKIEDINLEDLFTNSNEEISKLIHNKFPSLYAQLKVDYDKLQKSKELNSKIPESLRRKRLKELKEEITVTNTYIEMLGKSNSTIRNSYELKIFNLEKECAAIEETFNYKSYREIQEKAYLSIRNSIISLQNKVLEKINYLEGVMREYNER